jgi:hypothetical protein
LCFLNKNHVQYSLVGLQDINLKALPIIICHR